MGHQGLEDAASRLASRYTWPPLQRTGRNRDKVLNIWLSSQYKVKTTCSLPLRVSLKYQETKVFEAQLNNSLKLPNSSWAIRTRTCTFQRN